MNPEFEVLLVHGTLNETEEKDVDFFLDLWKQCADEKQRRDLIKSFRRQMINVAAGEAIALVAE